MASDPGVLVLHTRDPGTLCTLPTPAPTRPWASEDDGLFEPRRLWFAPCVSLPTYGTAAFDALELDDDEADGYFEACSAIQGDERVSFVGGYPDSHGEQFEDLEPDVVTLMRVDSHTDAKMCWWDAGTFNVVVPAEDLAGGRFDRCHAEIVTS